MAPKSTKKLAKPKRAIRPVVARAGGKGAKKTPPRSKPKSGIKSKSKGSSPKSSKASSAKPKKPAAKSPRPPAKVKAKLPTRGTVKKSKPVVTATKKSVKAVRPIPSKPKPSAPAKTKSAPARPVAVAKLIPAAGAAPIVIPALIPPKLTTPPPPATLAASADHSNGSKAKMLTREFLTDMARAIRDAVLPFISVSRGRDVVGTAPSGDATFELDKVAEKALLSFLKSAKMPVAYYSEDSGYTTFTNGQPANLLVVDPIDGSRSAKCGFESCVVSICSTRVIERPVIGNVDNGCVMELLGNRVFYAERGKGARMFVDGAAKRIKLSTNTNLETVAWAMTVPARPADLIFQTAAKLIDLTSLKGGFFACNSTAYTLTRLVTNQLDACVDFANRYYRDIPSVVEDRFINAGRGAVLGICPYDLAAALLIAQEAGCVVTDAYGKPLDDVLLLDSTVTNQRSLIAASNRELHKKLMSYFEARINQFEALLKKRAAARA